MKLAIGLFVIGAVLVIACGGSSSKPSATPTAQSATTPAVATPAGTGGRTVKTVTLTSTAFADGASIPTKYTCDGESVSPPLGWDGPPSGTQSLALIVDDPDAPSGTFVHWVIYDLPPSLRGLPEGVSTDAKPSTGGTNGKNGSGKSGYTGPCPPSGTHHYHFKLYALDTSLNAPSGWSKDQLLQAMQGRVIGQGELVGTFSRG